MTITNTFDRLIRFQDESGTTLFGEPKVASADAFEEAVANNTLEATVYEGNDILSATPTAAVAKVAKVLGLLTPDDVPIVKCVGLNYIKHSTSLFHAPIRSAC
jgi:hypothetical protein